MSRSGSECFSVPARMIWNSSEFSATAELARQYRMRGEWFRWEGAVCAAVEAALHDGRWRTVFGFSEPADEDWWTGSPLYERAA
jgi:hypothetical protein